MMDCLESVSSDLCNNVSLKAVFTGILKLLDLVTEAACEIPSFLSRLCEGLHLIMPLWRLFSF